MGRARGKRTEYVTPAVSRYGFRARRTEKPERSTDDAKESYSTCCSTSLSNLQRIVGGYIETVTFPDLGVVVICNEEGRLLGLPYCSTIRGVDFYGPVAVFRPDGENLADVQYKLCEWKEIVTD